MATVAPPASSVDHDEQGVVAGDGAEHLGQAGAVEGGGDDVGRAGRGAQDDEVAGVGDLDDPVAEHPAEVVLGGALVRGQLGDGVDGLAAGDPDLDGAEVLEVARHGGLGGGDAVGGQQLDEVGLAGDGVVGEQPGDAVLALRLGEGLGVGVGLGGHQASSSRKRSRPREACRRLWAWGKTRLCGPSTTEAVTSSPRWAGRQCRKMAVGTGRRHHGVVDGEALEGAAAGLGLGLLAHRGPDVGVDGVGALGGLGGPGR